MTMNSFIYTKYIILSPLFLSVHCTKYYYSPEYNIRSTISRVSRDFFYVCIFYRNEKKRGMSYQIETNQNDSTFSRTIKFSVLLKSSKLKYFVEYWKNVFRKILFRNQLMITLKKNKFTFLFH